jgi:cysteine desulfuration protein SufE
MATIAEIQKEIIEEFALFDDWMDKYNLIIEMGTSLAAMEEVYKKDENLVKGCQSKVWLYTRTESGKIIYMADSDAIITKGLIALLMRVLNAQSPDDIIQADLGFLDQIGMREHLSPTRSNGLNSMIKQMKYYAIAHKSSIQN